MIKKILKKLFRKKERKIFYKIGKKRLHNSLIDSLIPQMIEIGENFTSGPNSMILAHDASTYVFTGKYRVEKTIVGDNVFLGANAVILPGITVGNNIIIGAGSVVTKNILDGYVVAGNPAKIICTTEEYISKCNKKNVLYEVPESFKNLKENTPLTAENISEFQDIIMNEYKNKEKIKHED